jgi:hypothetical protein
MVATFGMLPLWLGGCASDTDSNSGDRGPSLAERVNFIGLGNLNVMLKRPPMHERGVRSVAVIYQGNGLLDLTYEVNAFLSAGALDEMPSGQLVSSSLGEDLFVEMINQGGFIRAHGYSQTHADLAKKIRPSIWNNSGVSYDAAGGEALVKDLGARGHDTVLLVKEFDISDYHRGNDMVRGAKGVVGDEESLIVYASFWVGLIDTASTKLRPLGTYIQASAKIWPDLVGQSSFQAFSADDRNGFVEAIKTLIENNVRQTLLAFKMIPIRGQEFMTWEELPESESVRFEYPE